MATGASDLFETEQAVEIILLMALPIVFFSNTNYTGDLENFRYVNLNVLRQFAISFPDAILDYRPYSGHATVLGAVALGARVIEKHFTDDNSRIGPDHNLH